MISRWISSGNFDHIASFVEPQKSAGPGFVLGNKKRASSAVAAELVRGYEDGSRLQRLGSIVNIGDRSKPKSVLNPSPIMFPTQAVEISKGKHLDTRISSYFSMPVVTVACPEANAYVETLNRDPASPFHVRQTPFVVDSGIFMLKVMKAMGFEIQGFNEIFEGSRWDSSTFQKLAAALSKLDEDQLNFVRSAPFTWADGAQNDSHARLGTAKAMVAAIRTKVPREKRFILGEELSDLMEVTASEGSRNFQGRVFKIAIDETLREKDWMKAMGPLKDDKVKSQGGTFSSGSGAVLPRNLHGNAETIVSFRIP